MTVIGYNRAFACCLSFQAAFFSFSMAGLVKWGIKLGAVGGAVYLAASERFFGSTEETADSYGRLKGWHWQWQAALGTFLEPF